LDKATDALLKGYLAKADEKLRAASSLLRQRYYPDAVSRAYYAVFHAAQAALLREGEQATTHRGLVTLFGLLLVKTGKIEARYGRFLSNLKDDREQSDYEVFAQIDRSIALRAIREARAFVQRIRRLVRSIR